MRKESSEPRRRKAGDALRKLHIETSERNKIIVLLVHGFFQIPKRGLQVTVDFRNFFECFGVHDAESGQLFVGSCKLILKKLHFVRSFQ